MKIVLLLFLFFQTTAYSQEWSLFDNGQKAIPEQSPKVEQPVAYYPTHPVRWNVNGHWNYSREYIIEHLMQGEHRGKFSREWLEALSMKELQSAHDDDHENRVKWEYVGKPTFKTPDSVPIRRTVKTTPVKTRKVENCPDGNCPRGGFLRNLFK